MSETTNKPKRVKPDWLKIKLPSGQEFNDVKKNIDEHKLHTICQSGKCPNQTECWGEGTATLMILGNVCTRSCQFCNVATGKPEEADPFEPARVAQSVKLMGLKHAVITSVDRDDLKDGGSEIWAKTVELIRKKNPGIMPLCRSWRIRPRRVVLARPFQNTHQGESLYLQQSSPTRHIHPRNPWP